MIKRRNRARDESTIDITPMLDIVFIMLIFFIVTTTFIKETGVEVNRPNASTAVADERGNILIAITENNEIYNWLAAGSVSNKYRDIPKIFLGIWDCKKVHRRRWPYPQNSRLYSTWVEINWDNLNFKLPLANNLPVDAGLIK